MTCYNSIYTAFGEAYKGFNLGSFTKLSSDLIGKCPTPPYSNRSHALKRTPCTQNQYHG